MVRKSVKVWMVICTLALILAAPVRASAYTIYDGNLSSTYTSIFRDLLSKKGINDDYLCFRSDQYEYVMLIGDLTYENGSFTGEKATEYKITSNTGYNSSYSYEVTQVRSIRLDPGSALLYSNLGEYPELQDPDDYFMFAQLLLIWVSIIMMLVHRIFEFTYKRGDGV